MAQIVCGFVVVATCLAVYLSPFAALAGDKLLGVILVSDGGTVSNATTGYGSAGCSHQTDPQGAGACFQAFPIGSSTLISIQCQDNSAMVVVNKSTTDAGEGILVSANQFLMSSTAVTPLTIRPLASNNSGMPDGGIYTGGVVAIAPIAGAAGARCKVFSRQGNE